ncbi:WG repeat-containing protein [candidate division CSSED10-310 bacterium]|uniref:WG repeat-containing protein n=1 Tax=candidate division CSSED10-310 bacterium TaxID=2855610 RepID=A0ABV6YVL6_UNCC1
MPEIKDVSPNVKDKLNTIVSNGKVSFIDENNEKIRAHNLEEIFNFHEGLARIKIESRWGYINKDGLPVIQAQFEEAADFSEGLAGV